MCDCRIECEIFQLHSQCVHELHDFCAFSGGYSTQFTMLNIVQNIKLIRVNLYETTTSSWFYFLEHVLIFNYHANNSDFF